MRGYAGSPIAAFHEWPPFHKENGVDYASDCARILQTERVSALVSQNICEDYGKDIETVKAIRTARNGEIYKMSRPSEKLLPSIGCRVQVAKSKMDESEYLFHGRRVIHDRQMSV